MMADQTIREKKEHPDTPKEQIAEIKEDHKKVRDLFLRVLLHLDKPCWRMTYLSFIIFLGSVMLSGSMTFQTMDACMDAARMMEQSPVRIYPNACETDNKVKIQVKGLEV